MNGNASAAGPVFTFGEVVYIMTSRLVPVRT